MSSAETPMRCDRIKVIATPKYAVAPDRDSANDLRPGRIGGVDPGDFQLRGDKVNCKRNDRKDRQKAPCLVRVTMFGQQIRDHRDANDQPSDQQRALKNPVRNKEQGLTHFRLVSLETWN